LRFAQLLGEATSGGSSQHLATAIHAGIGLLYFIRSRTKLSPDRQCRQESTKMVRWHSFNKALGLFSISETSFSRSEAHTPVHFPRSCFTAKGKKAKASLHKSQGIKIPSLLLVLGYKLALCSLPKARTAFLQKVYACALWPLHWAAKITQKVSVMGETRRKHLSRETFGDFKIIWCFVRWVPKLDRYNTYKS